MSQPPIDAVVAGTKGFAVALLAPLAQRVGGRPRIASDPAQALALCAGSARGLLVIEVQDGATVDAIARIAREAAGVRVVAGVPLAHAGAEDALRALGVEAVRWDGRPGPVLEAIDRKLAASPGAPVARAASATAAVPAPGSAGAPAPGAAAAARPPAPAPFAARPAAPARPAPAPARPAPAPHAPAAARPVAPAPAAAPATTRPGAPGPTPAPPPRSPAPAVDALVPGAPREAEEDVDLDFDGPEPPPAAAPRAEPPTPAEEDAPWPACVPDAADAHAALSASLAGTLAGDAPFASVVERTLAAVSNLERSILFGDPQPFEASPVRRAAVVRLRVAIALATAPPTGSTTDSGAVGAILGEIDGLLSEVSALTAAVPPELQRQLGAVRSALVKEAIDFAEAAQRVASGTVPEVVTAGDPPAARRRASPTRVLAFGAPEAPRRRGVGWAVLLAVVIAGAGAYHVHGHLEHERALSRVKTEPGAPAGMMLLAGGRAGARTFVPYGNRVPDAAQVEQFKALQRAQGFEVRDLAGGGFEIRAPRPDPTRRSSP